MKRAALLVLLLSVPAQALPLFCQQPAQVICGPVLGLPPGCWCLVPPPRPAVKRGRFTATLYPLHVVYAVPGRSSSMAYSQGDKVGSATSSGTSWKNGWNIEFDSKTGVFFAGGQLNIQAGQEWGSSAKGTVDVTVEHVSGYRKLGEADHVDHDADEVWFLMNQTLDASITPPSVYGPGSVRWSFSPSAPGTPYFLYAGEIRGAWAIPPGVQETLNRYGVSAEDVQGLRAVDPFIADPGKNPASDVARFELLWTGPYRPVSSPAAQPSPQSYAVTRRLANTIDQASDVTTTSSIKFGVDLEFAGLLKSAMSVTDKFSFTQSTSKKDSVETNTANTITIGQPTYGYTGPTVLRVYEDKVWKTYVFHLDWGQPAGDIGPLPDGAP